MSRVVLTYGTFDLFHYGHLRLLERCKSMGDKLVVGVSTDEFNREKGKKTIIPFSHRIELVRAIKYVDDCLEETSWDQKQQDILNLNASVLVMGSDWLGKFDHFRNLCKVEYLPRTTNISSSDIKYELNSTLIDELMRISGAVESMKTIVEALR